MAVSTAMFGQIVKPDRGDLSPELAHYVLSLSVPSTFRARYLKLSEKAQRGALTRKEETELDEYLSADAFLSTLKSKARVSLRKRAPSH